MRRRCEAVALNIFAGTGIFAPVTMFCNHEAHGKKPG
jgi:hypothetical protein